MRRQAMLHPPSHAQRPPLIPSPHRPPVTPPARAPAIWTQAYFLLRAPSVPKVHGAPSLSLQKGDRASLGPLHLQLPRAGRLAGWQGGPEGGGPSKPSVSLPQPMARGLGRAGPKSQRAPALGHLLPLSHPERPARPSDVLGGPPGVGSGLHRCQQGLNASLSPLRFLLTPLSLQITASP